ncbi:hypothetical protein PNEG_04297 [Pneumocystis murina B123]|uniref:Uncharacterized protein n=1 Tax=Pneumocystis murina (strain B123) TaxID=1069680 RepID=A0A0W4ZX02_PNEMU|nr:hypothetical protein PNEG_04297 [Pneumocystis murina B123]KTW32893.1 hypothetical protein PNEG_04297 [Pneumocystis murina B123]
MLYILLIHEGNRYRLEKLRNVIFWLIDSYFKYKSIDAIIADIPLRDIIRIYINMYRMSALDFQSILYRNASQIPGKGIYYSRGYNRRQ